jgi:hypothetical protein
VYNTERCKISISWNNTIKYAGVTFLGEDSSVHDGPCIRVLDTLKSVTSESSITDDQRR